MNLRLITYQAEDGLELDGAYYTAGEAGRSAAPLIVMTHGAWMNFYTGPQRFLPQSLVPAGFDCLAINSRDRDLGGMHPQTGRCFGMLRCRYEDILLDLSGALAWGRANGYRSFILLCHSYSSQRAAFYLSQKNDDGIEALAMLSPPAGMRSNRRFWIDDWEGFAGQARALVAAGKPDDIVVERPSAHFPIIASARTVLDIWVDSDPMETFAFMEGLTTPLLITLGAREARHGATRRNAERIAGVWAGPVTRVNIPECGHYYLENTEGLAEVVLDWLSALVSRPGSSGES